jgi:hypothetical protein
MELGHYPSILAISAITKSYRRDIRGSLIITGDNIAHFEPNPNGIVVWELIEGLMTQFNLIGNKTIARFAFSPPPGFHYIELFHPTHRNDILKVLGPKPQLKEIISLDRTYRTNPKGFLWETGHSTFDVVFAEVEVDLWKLVIVWGAMRPEARITN